MHSPLEFGKILVDRLYFMKSIYFVRNVDFVDSSVNTSIKISLFGGSDNCGGGGGGGGGGWYGWCW